MQIRKIFSIIVIAISVISAYSCKKDKSTEVPSLNGSLSIKGVETFIAAKEGGTEIVLKAGGNVSHPAGGKVGYYWKISPLMDKYDTTLFDNGKIKEGSVDGKTFKYTVKDTLATLTIYCYAYASGYSGLSSYAYTTTVRGGLVPPSEESEISITDTGIPSRGTKINETDYYYCTIGDTEWLMNNIHIDRLTVDAAVVKAGNAIWGYDVMSDIFGRYYSYDEAVAVCEKLAEQTGESWRLPSDEDWMKAMKHLVDTNADMKDEAKEYMNNLPANSDVVWDTERFGRPTIASQLMGDIKFNGLKLWEYWPGPGVIENTSGLTIMPVGYSDIASGVYSGVYDYAAFWTSTEDPADNSKAYYRYLFSKEPNVLIGRADKKSFGASVRCVK